MSTPTTSRKLLAGAAALPAALALPATASAPEDDSHILTLFDQWLRAQRAMTASPSDSQENERKFKQLHIAADAIRDRIASSRPRTAVGLAIIGYLLLHDIHTPVMGDDALVTLEFSEFDTVASEHITKSFLKHAVRLLPGLANGGVS